MKHKLWPLALYLFLGFQTQRSGQQITVNDLITIDPAPRYFVELTVHVSGNRIWIQLRYEKPVLFLSDKFFEIFPRIIVKPNYDLSDLAARYNYRYASVPNFVPVEIWWIMSHDAPAKTNDLQETQRANLKYPGTVSTWYIRIFAGDLKVFPQYLKKNIEPVWFGDNGMSLKGLRMAVNLWLENEHNCIDIVNQAFYLTNITSITIGVRESRIVDNPSSSETFECLKRFHTEKNITNTKFNFVGVISYSHSVLYRDDRFKVSCQSQDMCNKLELVTNDMKNDTTSFMIYKLNNTDSGILNHPNRVQCEVRNSNTLLWTEAGLSNQTGFSIYFETNYTASMLFQIAKTSPNLLVENKYQLDDSNKERFQNFVDMFLLMLETYSKELNSSLHTEEIVLQSVLFRKTTRQPSFLRDFIKWATLFGEAARTINRLWPKLVKGAIFRKTGPHIAGQNTPMIWSDMYAQLKQALNKNSELKLGLQNEYNIYPDFKDCPAYLKRSHMYDLVMLEFQIELGRQCLNSYQSVISEEATGEFLNFCGSKDYLKTFPSEQLIIFVHIVGCKANSSKSEHGIVQYEQVIDRLNKLSTLYDLTFYIGSAIQEPADPLQVDLYPNLCGWWHVETNATGFKHLKIRRPDEQNASNTSFATFAPPVIVSPKEAEGETKWLWILLPIIAICLASVGITVVLVLRFKNKYLLQNDEIKALFEGQALPNDVNTGTENADALASKYDKEKFEIPKSYFSFDASKSLGSGEFGTVHLGTITQGNETIPVAIKTTKQSSRTPQHSDLIALRGLISEIKLLSYIGNHKNIVGFLGAYTEKIGRGYIAVFLEYCSNGCLLNFLRKRKTQSPPDGDTDERAPILESGLRNNMMRWSIQIVNGMEYLSSKKIVHADLAARNVLLDSEFVAKVADFGLSRRLYNYTNYVKQKQEPLPWRWMAPEALQNLVFNEKTDVWAYGVLLWEIFTLGSVPYPGLSWDVNFTGKLNRGLRLPMPMFNQKEIYTMMLKCWRKQPDSRPTFAVIKSELEGKLENEEIVEQGDANDDIANSSETCNGYTETCF